MRKEERKKEMRRGVVAFDIYIYKCTNGWVVRCAGRTSTHWEWCSGVGRGD